MVVVTKKLFLDFYLGKIKELPSRVMARELFESIIYF
jgi:hypothetical protein